MPAAPKPGAQFNFFLSKCKQHKKNMTLLLYKLISHSSNKKFRFSPVQSPPGCLQHLNLEPNSIIFFKYVNNKKIWHFCFTSWSLTLQIRNLGFLSVQSPPGCLQHLNLEPNFIFFLHICEQHKKNKTFLFYKLISYSSNKKFRFLPVQSPPGCLQHLNLDAYST